MEKMEAALPHLKIFGCRGYVTVL